ncbi:hypothetical protein SISNIDRAFT_550303 [Sistotremastrum niveocremeum HHB9708]|uniref:Uncharacterized protein n=1 Tax=Sistotremastrum niveocremeum HHB9708 TaxID=1314777 RepID=A0A164TZ14_9AGAM|nr:hypothetical protein SISNIDRAFT_550303 [Sistotremastrum niveocremeum HHB9708]
MNPFAPTSLSFEGNCVCRLGGEIHPACTAHGHLSDVNRQDGVSFAEFRAENYPQTTFTQSPTPRVIFLAQSEPPSVLGMDATPVQGEPRRQAQRRAEERSRHKKVRAFQEMKALVREICAHDADLLTDNILRAERNSNADAVNLAAEIIRHWSKELRELKKYEAALRAAAGSHYPLR